jgi:hypothetical protein
LERPKQAHLVLVVLTSQYVLPHPPPPPPPPETSKNLGPAFTEDNPPASPP